jgi:chaperonin cofactor prefoldin
MKSEPYLCRVKNLNLVAMTFQEKIQDAVNTFVSETKQNVETTKEQVTSALNEVVSAAKEEIELQKTTLPTYKERIQSLVKKDFNKETIKEDLKGELEYFGNELKSTVDRNIERFKNIFSAVTPAATSEVKVTEEAPAAASAE